jgi:hypothetical protein
MTLFSPGHRPPQVTMPTVACPSEEQLRTRAGDLEGRRFLAGGQALLDAAPVGIQEHSLVVADGVAQLLAHR